MTRDVVHTVPAGKRSEHHTDSLGCWCAPAYLLPCDECEDGCWKCIDGSIPLTRAMAEASDSRIVVVHNP